MHALFAEWVGCGYNLANAYNSSYSIYHCASKWLPKRLSLASINAGHFYEGFWSYSNNFKARLEEPSWSVGDIKNIIVLNYNIQMFFQSVNVPVCFDGNLHMYCKNQPSTHMINFAAEPFQHLHYTYNTQAYYKLALWWENLSSGFLFRLDKTRDSCLWNTMPPT